MGLFAEDAETFLERKNLFYLIDFGLLSGEKSHSHGSPNAYNRRHRGEARPSIAGTQRHPAKHDVTTKFTLARDGWFSSAQSTSRDAGIDTVSGKQLISCPSREELIFLKSTSPSSSGRWVWEP
jgi:hypothetical protein